MINDKFFLKEKNWPLHWLSILICLIFSKEIMMIHIDEERLKEMEQINIFPSSYANFNVAELNRLFLWIWWHWMKWDWFDTLLQTYFWKSFQMLSTVGTTWTVDKMKKTMKLTVGSNLIEAVLRNSIFSQTLSWVLSMHTQYS